MMDDQDPIQAERADVIRVQQLRWRFLLELYRMNKQAHAGTIQSVSAEEVGTRIGLLETRDLEQAYAYLADAGLVELVGFGPLLRITRTGIDEVEEAYARPDQRTDHLPPLNIIHNVIYGGVHGSTVQQGTTQSTQTVDNSQSVDWARLREILREVRTAAEDLPAEQRDEVLADVIALDAQSRSPRPKAAIVRECLTSLRSILGNLAGNTAGNIAAAPLIDWIRAHEWLLK